MDEHLLKHMMPTVLKTNSRVIRLGSTRCRRCFSGSSAHSMRIVTKALTGSL